VIQEAKATQTYIFVKIRWWQRYILSMNIYMYTQDIEHVHVWIFSNGFRVNRNICINREAILRWVIAHQTMSANHIFWLPIKRIARHSLMLRYYLTYIMYARIAYVGSFQRFDWTICFGFDAWWSRVNDRPVGKPQEQGVMNIAASFSLSKKPR
jgi:hypothetical protein